MARSRWNRGDGYESAWPVYVPAAERRDAGRAHAAKLEKKGRVLAPVRLPEGRGRALARTFWGKAWCDNLESYSDYENRLPRGRAYVRNGSILDLQIAPKRITAVVYGTSPYTITIDIAPLPPKRWKLLVATCSGKVESLVELLSGKLSDAVMENVTQSKTGLFPSPAEIEVTCSCPDYATMCKHVAAALYGVGARLDEKPELLFTLRDVDAAALLVGAAGAATGALQTLPKASTKKMLATDLASVFGIEMESEAPARAPKKKRRAPAQPARARG